MIMWLYEVLTYRPTDRPTVGHVDKFSKGIYGAKYILLPTKVNQN